MTLPRAYRIALYFASDERNHPIQMTLSTLFGFFSNLMAVYYIAQPNERSIASLLGVQPFVARDYDRGTSRLFGRTDLRHHPPDTPHRRLLEGGRCQYPYEPALL